MQTEPSKAWLEEIIYNFHNPTVTVEKSKITLSKYLDTFVAEMESGKRLNISKKRYTLSTIKKYSINTIGRHVKELKIIMRAARCFYTHILAAKNKSVNFTAEK